MFAAGSITDVLALFVFGFAGLFIGLIGLILRIPLPRLCSLPLGPAGKPEHHWFTLMAVGVVLVVLATCRSENLVSGMPGQETLDAVMPAYKLVKPAVSPLTTDGGRSVQVFTVPNYTPVTVERESKFITARALTKGLISTGQSNQNSNCHGWTFAAGKFWIMDEDVEMILADNGYQPVAFPQPGDLAVYRTSSGQVAHSGIVRQADQKANLIWIESKWTILGCFLHAPEQTPYAAECVYYHTERPFNHLLQGILENVDGADNKLQL
jgi:hypothetical protein